MTKRSTAHYFLEGLTDIGVDYIFANLGTDHVSLIEELARWDSEGPIWHAATSSSQQSLQMYL